MVRRNEIFGISILVLFCLVLIIFKSSNTTNNINTKNALKGSESVLVGAINEEDNTKNNDNVVITIEDIIASQKLRIKRSLRHYKTAHLSNLSIANGGQPIRTVIFATWRSGSTFLGDILNALPANFYHYEPLLDYGIVQIRGAPYSDEVITRLKHLFHCNYTELHDYLQFGMTHLNLFSHNVRLWYYCEMYPQFCWNSEFLNKFCALFPFQSTKIVRLRLWLAEELLKDTKLNVKVVLLVRDPRGVLQSRKHRAWCPGEPDCDQPAYLCSDMVADYSAAIELQRKYPNRFIAVRYEELSLNPQEIISDLFNFLGLEFHVNVKQFLDSHTKMNVGGVSSTFRDSRNAAFHWRTDLNFSEIKYVEDHCFEAMKLWGYAKTGNSPTSLKDFYPLRRYRIE